MEEYRTQNEDLREENQRLTEELESAAAKYAKLDGALTDEKDASADIQKQSVEQIRQLGEENKHLKEEIAQMKIEASTKTEKSERVDDARSVELERMKEETQRNQLEIAKLKLELEQSNATCARLKKDMESQTLPKDSTELHSLYMREHEQLEFITDYVHHLEEQINTELLRVAPQSQHLDTTPTHEKLSQLIASLREANPSSGDASLAAQLETCADQYMHRLIGDVCSEEKDPLERLKKQFEVTGRRSQKLTSEFMVLRETCSRMASERATVESVRPLVEKLAVHMHVIDDSGEVSWSDLTLALQRLDDIAVNQMPLIGLRIQQMQDKVEREKKERRRCQEELRVLKTQY